MKTMKLWKWILCIVFGFFLFMIIYSVAQAPLLMDLSLPLSIFLGLFNTAALLGLYACWVRLTEKRWPSELSLKKAPLDLSFGYGIGFIYFIAITFVMVCLGCYRMVSLQFDAYIVFKYFFGFLIVAAGEEVVFRGILHRMIATRYNLAAALIISALLFGFIHITNPNATLWSAIAISIEAGLMLGMAYTFRENLWIPIGIHWAWNFTQGIVFGFAVSGLDIKHPIISAQIEGNELVTGGSFGAEASIIAVLFGLAITYWLYLLKRRKA